MCGEKFVAEELKVNKQGSPPRVRGKVEVVNDRPAPPRITPACAGKRNCIKFFWIDTEDHPRVCGEKRVLMAFSELIKGSPPRVRGKDDSIGRSKFNARITPACAGKRHHRGHPSWQAQDHPRVCGEKYCGISLHLTIQGSPPRVRGKD